VSQSNTNFAAKVWRAGIRSISRAIADVLLQLANE
jgi:hypothetical protein